MRDLVIFGTGGHARELADLVADVNADGGGWNLLGHLDDRAADGSEVGGLPLLGGRDWLRDRAAGVDVVVGIGAPAVRRRVAMALAGDGARFPELRHPSAVVSARVRSAPGAIVTAGCVLTVDVVLGAHVHLNRCATVSHDCQLGAWTTIAPGAVLAGDVRLGEGCDIGAGAVIIQGRAIGPWSIVGAGATVVHDLPANCTAVGVPARIIKQRDPSWHLH